MLAVLVRNVMRRPSATDGSTIGSGGMYIGISATWLNAKMDCTDDGYFGSIHDPSAPKAKRYDTKLFTVSGESTSSELMSLKIFIDDKNFRKANRLPNPFSFDNGSLWLGQNCASGQSSCTATNFDDPEGSSNMWPCCGPRRIQDRANLDLCI